MIASVIFLLILITVMAGVIFMYTAPQFGQKPHGAHLERISNSPNYVDGQFINPVETSMGSFSEMMSTLPDFIFGKNLKPEKPLPVRYGDNQDQAYDSLCFVTWYGHSAFLIEMEDKRILIDPMLGERPSPFPFGTSRFSNEEPVPIKGLTNIDFIILSHDHYDHLDYSTIMQLKEEVGHFYTALGVGSHLVKWGIPKEKITELDWWQSTVADNLTLTACPA
ncbi:MAG: MBL fold metallo-hydrolase, partial [Cyclobacteriaceae bacterium]